MSKLFNKKINIKPTTKFQINNDKLVVKGDLGENLVPLNKEVEVVSKEGIVTFNVDKVKDKINAGTFISNVENAIFGVEKAYSKVINLVGVGYKVEINGNNLIFNVGFSNPVIISLEKNIEVVVQSPIKMIVKSINNIKLGDYCANIVKKTRPVEPYKGKGVIIEGTKIIRKEGKKK